MPESMLGPTGSKVYDAFMKILELISIILGFYAILNTSSAPFIEAEDDSEEENRLLVDYIRATRTFVVAAISIYGMKFLLDTVVRELLHIE